MDHSSVIACDGAMTPTRPPTTDPGDDLAALAAEPATLTVASETFDRSGVDVAAALCNAVAVNVLLAVAADTSKGKALDPAAVLAMS